MEIKNKFIPDPKIKLMDQVRQVLRYHHYSMSTEKTYCDWISRYIKFHQCKRHPSEMGKREQVLDISIDEQLSPVKAKKHHRPPMVMTKNEIKKVLGNISGTHLLKAKLLYRCGLRLMECVRMRIQDVDFERNLIYVRAAKGNKEDEIAIVEGKG